MITVNMLYSYSSLGISNLGGHQGIRNIILCLKYLKNVVRQIIITLEFCGKEIVTAVRE